LKLPICLFDAKSGLLCQKCEARLEGGEITQDDVDASIKLTRLAERDAEINKFTFTRGVRLNGDIVLIFRGQDLNMLRSNTNLANKIQSAFESKVWFVQSEASDRRFVENLLYPLRVLSVNQFWLPDGNKLTKVVVSKQPKQQKADTTKIQKIAKAVKDMELLIEFG
jgi:transcription antitermination factor NusA-like protein